MTRSDIVRVTQWTIILAAGATLTACATPQYAVRGGPGGGGQIAQGSTVRPPSSGAHGTMAPYQVGGIWYVPREQPDYDQTGVASWYGQQFNLKATANGELFDLDQFSAAHTTLPLPSMVEVTNLDNGRKLVVRVNDRGPFVGGRLIDLSQAAARELGYERAGVAHVRVRYVGPAPVAGPDAGVRYAKATPAYPVRSASSMASSVTQVSSPIRATGAGRRPADEEIFADAAPRTGDDFVPAHPVVAPPVAVSVASLTPLPEARPASPPPVMVSSFRDVSPDPAAGGVYRVQAGAFGDEGNARRAVAQLAAVGAASIEPFQKAGVTMYRVTLPGAADEAEAYGVRDKVAAAGFTDARVLRPVTGLQ